MKSKLLIIILSALALSDCEKKNAENPSKFPIIEKTAKDATQPDYIRESANIFEQILKEDKKVLKTDWIQASYDLLKIRNNSTIATYVEFLKSLERKLPDELPTIEKYNLSKELTSKSEFIEFNVARTILLMGESIKDISVYGDLVADNEIETILKRFKKKYGSSETGKKIMAYFIIVHEQGLEERATETKPWETPRRPPVYFSRSKKP